MFKQLATSYRRIRGLIWFEQVDRGVEWPLETSPRRSAPSHGASRAPSFGPTPSGIAAKPDPAAGLIRDRRTDTQVCSASPAAKLKRDGFTVEETLEPGMTAKIQLKHHADTCMRSALPGAGRCSPVPRWRRPRRHAEEPPADAALLGRPDRQPADRRSGALGHAAPSTPSNASPARPLSCSPSPRRSPNAPASGASSTASRRRRWKTCADHGAIPLLQLELARPVPSSREPAPFRLGDDHRRHLRRLHPRIRRSGEEMGPPLLPPLRLGDERLLVPLARGRQRQQARRVRRRLAPRPRHLHLGRRHQRDLGLVPERRLHPQADPAGDGSTRATTTSTGPASTASTGARRATRPAGRTSTRSSTRPTSGCCKIAPDKPMVIGEVASERARRLEGRTGSSTPAERSCPASTARSAALIWFDEQGPGHALADRELTQAADQRLRQGDPAQRSTGRTNSAGPRPTSPIPAAVPWP